VDRDLVRARATSANRSHGSAPILARRNAGKLSIPPASAYAAGSPIGKSKPTIVAPAGFRLAMPPSGSVGSAAPRSATRYCASSGAVPARSSAIAT
jgi:hypothetical protein